VVLRLTVFRAAPVPVTVYRVQEGRVEDTVVNSRAGTVNSRHRAQMSPGVAGLVLEIPVKKGQAVRQGQVLLRLDSGEYRAAVTLASRSLDAAKAAADEATLLADQATRARKRAEALAGQALLSDQALEEAGTQAETAQASLQAARERVKQAAAALAASQATLDKTTMIAPFAGMVPARRVHPSGRGPDRSRFALRERTAR
jgi:HlyD family secretion protein